MSVLQVAKSWTENKPWPSRGVIEDSRVKWMERFAANTLANGKASETLKTAGSPETSTTTPMKKRARKQSLRGVQCQHGLQHCSLLRLPTKKLSHSRMLLTRHSIASFSKLRMTEPAMRNQKIRRRRHKGMQTLRHFLVIKTEPPADDDDDPELLNALSRLDPPSDSSSDSEDDHDIALSDSRRRVKAEPSATGDHHHKASNSEHVGIYWLRKRDSGARCEFKRILILGPVHVDFKDDDYRNGTQHSSFDDTAPGPRTTSSRRSGPKKSKGTNHSEDSEDTDELEDVENTADRSEGVEVDEVAEDGSTSEAGNVGRTSGVSDGGEASAASESGESDEDESFQCPANAYLHPDHGCP
jgi:hypothetical protein